MLNIKHPIVDGYIAVPDGSGLGMDLEEEIGQHLPADEPLWSSS